MSLTPNPTRLGVNPNANPTPPPSFTDGEGTTKATESDSDKESKSSSHPQVVDAIRKNLLGPDAKDFADVTFVTKDNEKIPACRALLGIRSPYFKNLFFLPFKERSQHDIPVDLVASALREILHFAYTDSSPLLEMISDAINHAGDHKPFPERTNVFQPTSRNVCVPAPIQRSGTRVSAGTSLGKRRHPDPTDISPSVKQLVELIHAADYVQMPALAKRALSSARKVTTTYPHTVCSAYEALHVTPAGMCEDLKMHLEKLIRHNPNQCLGVPDVRSRPAVIPLSMNGVRILNEASIEFILSDNDIFTSETYLFETLFFWATGSLVSDLRGSTDAKLLEWKHMPRWPAAKKLVSHIDLERMKPSFLRDYVIPSTLVELTNVYTTFMHQALEAERGRPLYDNFRGGSHWQNDSKRVCAIFIAPKNYPLKCPWVSSGKHEWTFRILRNAPYLWLGITMKEPSPNAGLFYEQNLGWAYSTSGRIFPSLGTDFFKSTGPVGPVVSENGTVKLVLNLLKSGTLTIVVEGTPKAFPAFRDLRSKANSFLPAVAISAPAEIELIGEKHYIIHKYVHRILRTFHDGGDDKPLLNDLPVEAVTHLRDHGYAVVDDIVPEETRKTLLSETHALLQTSHAGKNNTHLLNTTADGDGSTHTTRKTVPKSAVTQAELTTLPLTQHAAFPTLSRLHADASLAAQCSVFWPRLTLTEQAVKAQVTTCDGSFPIHVDGAPTQDRRVVTALLYPHDEWQHGGEHGALRLYDSPISHTDIVPESGRLVLLSSRMLHHRVLSTPRPRVTITVWMSGNIRTQPAPHDVCQLSSAHRVLYELLTARFRDVLFKVVLRDEWVRSLREAHSQRDGDVLVDRFLQDLDVIGRKLPAAVCNIVRDGNDVGPDVESLEQLVSDPSRLRDAFREFGDAHNGIPFIW